ncbi:MULTISPECIES: LytR/AlgR family response regulator transcription factor [unclassified Oceanobacillus]|uniref:LytR/AlgR family response regulator transcription factor n=1 Tax=unclassified Oceanobacillus TaxID=2630292 RepID=UPI00300E4194
MDRVIRTIVVDDELYNREDLKHLLGSYPQVEVVGEAASGEEAVMKVIQLKPDVVFLDIEMPKMSGMEVAKSMRELKNPPLIVFATAYPQFAVEAFRYDAVDYLLKPYDEELLRETIDRIIGKIGPVRELPANRLNGKLAVQSDGEISYIEPEDILYIAKSEKYSNVVTKHGEFDSNLPLKDLGNKLAEFGFFRIHKSTLVNLHYVQRLTPWFNGAYHLELRDTEERLSVSRNYVKDLRKELEI